MSETKQKTLLGSSWPFLLVKTKGGRGGEVEVYDDEGGDKRREERRMCGRNPVLILDPTHLPIPVKRRISRQRTILCFTLNLGRR